MIKKLLFLFLKPFFIHLFSPLFAQYYYWYCCQKIDELPEKTQLFLVARRDFGTYLMLLAYLRAWNETRGKTALIVLTGYLDTIKELTSLISPETILIGPENKWAQRTVAFFGARGVHFHCFASVYARLVVDYPNALFLFHQPSRYPYPSHYSSYIPYFDPYLPRDDTPFTKAYKGCRQLLDFREEAYLDMLHLVTTSKRMPLASSIPGPYVVMNINCKNYTFPVNRRQIFHPERYNPLINWLIDKGFTVVIQGRQEQPHFAPRSGLIDTSRNKDNSPATDLALFAGAAFAILTKTGPENFAMLTGTPLLGLNYVELSSMTPHTKARFFPKHLIKKGKRLSWQELLQAPSYFDLGVRNFDPDVIYEELTENELIAATEEFMPLVDKDTFDNLTERQKAFRGLLSPCHLDLYHVESHPCDVYLRGSTR